MRQLLFKGIIYRVIYYISLYLLTLLMSRYYQASGSGLIYYNITLLAWVILLLSFCVETAMTYYLSTGMISAAKLSGLAIAWALVAGLVSYILIDWLLPRSETSLRTSFFYVAVFFIVGNLLISFFSALYYGFKDFVTPNIILTVFNCILIILIPKRPLGHLTEDWFIDVYLISFLLEGIMLALFFAARRVPGFKLEFPDLKSIKLLLNFSTWAFSVNALSMVLCRVDYWFVNHYCSSFDLGNYIQASKVGQVFLIVPAVISSAVFPMTASGMLPDPSNSIQSLSRSLLFCTAIPGILLVLTGNWLFPFVFGASFDSMYMPFLLMMPGILAFCIISPITSYYGGKKMLYVNLVSLLVGVSFMILADTMVVPRYGTRGAAAMSSLGYLGYTACLLWFFRRDHKVSFANFFTLRAADFDWMRNTTARDNTI